MSLNSNIFFSIIKENVKGLGSIPNIGVPYIAQLVEHYVKKKTAKHSDDSSVGRAVDCSVFKNN